MIDLHTFRWLRVIVPISCVILVVWMLGEPAYAAEPPNHADLQVASDTSTNPGPSSESALSADARKRVEDERHAFAAALPRIEAEVLAATHSPGVANELRLWQELVSADSDPKTCATDVVGYIRERYAVTPLGTLVVSEHGKNLGEMAAALYEFKHESSGLYEYTKLTGLMASPVDRLWKVEPVVLSDGLLRYRLYLVAEEMSVVRQQRFKDGGLGRSMDLSEELALLSKQYPDSQLVRSVVMSYPFDPDSHIGYAIRARDADDNVEDVNALIIQYVKSVLQAAPTTADIQFLHYMISACPSSAVGNIVSALLPMLRVAPGSTDALREAIGMLNNASATAQAAVKELRSIQPGSTTDLAR